MLYKYPHTMHLPFSPGLQNDDRRIETLDFLNGKNVVVTEKMDGENTTMTKDVCHARSLDSGNHPSRNWVKRQWGQIKHLIGPTARISGENLYAKHSIEYSDLLSYFYGFGVWVDNEDGHRLLDWDETQSVFLTLGITSVPVLWTGIFSTQKIKELVYGLDTDKQEGLVVRVTSAIPYDMFHLLAAKWVRKGHVQTDEHWTKQKLVINGLKDQPVFDAS